MKGHSWRCFYTRAKKKMRLGCDRGADEIELLGGDDMRAYEGADDKWWRWEDDGDAKR